MKILLATLLLSLSLPVSAAVWLSMYPNGQQVWMGNVCRTAIGQEIVPPQPVGAVCYSPTFRAYGFIANQ